MTSPGRLAVALKFASIPFVKATYPQFYLLWMPFLAALAIYVLATRPFLG